MLILAGFACYFNYTPKSYVEDKSSTGLPKLGGPFSLTDQFGNKRKNSEFLGKYMMVYFGYSFCPDVCPMGLQHISKALELLGTDIDQVTPLFITIDPERDTQENLKVYAQNWHSSFIFLTGSQEEINPVLEAYKVYTMRARPDGTMADYLIDHSAFVYLMDRSGNLISFFPHTSDPQVMAQTVREHLLKEHQSH